MPAFALWMVSTVNKAQNLAAQWIGIAPSAAEKARTQAVTVATAQNQEIRRASILDTGIVILGLASIILTGLMVGRAPGTFVMDRIWQIIFGLCSVGIIYCGVRLIRLARP